MKRYTAKLRIYIDTSVIGGCFDIEFQEWSNALIEEFVGGKRIAIISDITLEEIEEAPTQVQMVIKRIPKDHVEFIILNNEAEYLASLYVREGAISKKFEEDALHIALATVNKVDVLVSWNFKHIVNIERIRLYNSINLKYGYPILEIRDPREVL